LRVDEDPGFRTLVVVEDGVEGGFGAGEGLVVEAGGLAELGMGEAFAFAVEDQLGVVDEGHAVGCGEVLRAGTDEVDVGTFFEDEAGGLNGVAEAFDAGDAAGLHAATVHEEGVKLYAAVGGEKAAAASVEGGVVFEDGDGGFDGVESRRAAGEKSVTGFESLADTGQVSGSSVGGNGPCATVNEESWGVGGGGHLAIVEHSAEERQGRILVGKTKKL
jgi:hypothetical protein